MSKYICPRCYKELRTQKGLHIHQTRKNHWRDETPPPPPKETHVNYIDIARNFTWGRKMTKEEEKSPSREELLLGAVFWCAEKLDLILHELKREKRIK